MAYLLNAKTHALLKGCLTMALLALALIFGPVILKPNVQADPGDKGQAQKPGGLKPLATGAISGTVTDASTFAPLQSVSVVIFDSDGNFATSATTNNSGIYTTLAVLATGTYFAKTINSLGYLNELYKNVDCFFICDPTIGTPISVTDGLTTSNINFALEPGGRISGVVTDAATSAPLAEVNVLIVNSTGEVVASTATISSGQYISDAGLPSGTYFARTFNSQGYIDELYDNINCFNCDLTDGTPITVTLPSTTSGINFALSPGGKISGTITSAATSAPLFGVAVFVFDSSGNTVASGSTNASGNYITGQALVTGTYFVQTSNFISFIDEVYDNIACRPCDPRIGTPVSVTSGSTTSGINFALSPGGIISGNVTDVFTNEPIPDVFIEVFNANGNFVTSTFTNEFGNYQTPRGLSSGTYYVRARAFSSQVDELYNNIECATCNVTSGTPVAVTAGSLTSGINFALQAGGIISGTVTSAATSAPISNALIDIYNAGGIFVTTSGTDEFGNYTAIGLPAGTYFARTSGVDGFADKLYNNQTCAGCGVTSGTPITVSFGTTSTGSTSP